MHRISIIKFDAIKTYTDLNEYINQHYQRGKTNYILVDEIQDIDEFERSVRSWRTEPDAEVIITGSNAKILSGELSTLIGGRFKEIRIQSLSYSEFLVFHQLEDSDDALTKYIQFGGLPGLAKIGIDEDDAREYQRDIYNTVLLKDVIMRNKIRNVAFLENLVRFLADNIGKIISANSISKYMKSQGQSVTVGQLKAGEIDFVCERKDGRRAYVQASYIIADEQTREREFGNLQSIRDNYPKYVVSMTPLVSHSDEQGITHLHLRRFLMSDNLD